MVSSVAPLLGANDAIGVFIQGARSGIGLGLCRTILAHCPNAYLFASYRTAEQITELTALQRQYSERVILLQLDLGSENSISDIASKVTRHTDKLHLLINVSGVLHTENMVPEKRIADIDYANLITSFESNVFGAMLVTQSLHSLLIHSGPSIVANISARVGSIADNRLGGWYAYRCSKAALNMFCKNYAIEMGRIKADTAVVAVHPGTTDTDLSKPFQRRVKPEKLFSVTQTSEYIYRILFALTAKDNGRFIAWDGNDIPW